MSPNPGKISDADLLKAYKVRERQERTALFRVRACQLRHESAKEETKAAKDALEEAQAELAMIVGQDLQTTIAEDGEGA